MKIGLVRRGYSATGGAEAYLLRLAGELARRDHEVTLFSDVPWPGCALRPSALEHHQRVVRGSTPRHFAEDFEKICRGLTLDRVFSMERILACDIYRAGDGVHAAWMHRRARFEPFWKPLLRGLNPKHRQILALERTLFTGGARRVIANSEMVKREIGEHFGTPENHIAVVHNGLPSQIAPPEARREVRAELGLSESEYVAIFVGSGWARKGLRFAIEAVKQTPGVTLLVAGRGKARSLPSDARVRFLGPRRDVPKLLAAADVFILPTLYDPFSNASLEALAAGLPVITTAANGFAEIIQPGEEGDVVWQPDDIAALSRALAAWSDPTRREAIRPRLLTLGAQYSIEENVRQTLDLLEREAGG